MKLIVGLGNPGRDYENTRHNAGFLTLSKLAEDESINWGNEAKGNVLVSKVKIDGETAILALPQSYMNLSGEVVLDLLKWFKLEKSDLIVVHDELDLPLGQIQIRKNIGPAGHNGIKSIIGKIGEDFIRVRIGIGPTDKTSEELKNVVPSEKYVLEKFSSEEKKIIDNAINEAIEKIKLLVKYGYEDFISRYNS